MDKTEIEQALSALLESMDLPKMRRDITTKSNLRWIGRNLMVNNSENPEAREARILARTLLRMLENPKR
tara:strand:- start:1087 stop:1293 length:207 start_codon:yes stop_codon:yes gene_type:complete